MIILATQARLANKAFALLALLVALEATLPSKAIAAPVFFLSPGPGQPGGRGTEEDPWITPSAAEFDARMRAIPAEAEIRLAEGTFETHGWGAPGQQGFLVKSGWIVQGAGMRKTTVRLVGCVVDQQEGSGIGRIFFTGWGPAAERVVFRDLTADCNHEGVARAMNRKAITVEAIHLMGREFRVERVRAINALGKRGAKGVNPEAFIIGVAPRDDTTDATGYWVEDCVVEQFGGGECTAIGLLGKGGREGAVGAFRRNRVALNGRPGEFGFSSYGCRDFIIEKNRSSGTSRAFNWDTPAPGRGLIIRSNEFLQCTGWAFTLGGGGDSIIENNLIELAHPAAVGIQISAANRTFPGARNWTIRNNQFRSRSASATLTQFYEGKPVPGCVFENNRIQGRVTMDASAHGFAVWRNNRDGSNRALRNNVSAK